MNVPNTLPVRVCAWPVTRSCDGQTLDGRLSRLGSAAIGGTFKCVADQDAGCRLEAETAAGIATNAPSEHLGLKGSVKTLGDKLGVRGQGTSFTLQTEAAEGG
jgi:hypothetical protein